MSPVSDAAEAHGDAGAGSSSSDSSREGEPLKNTAARAPAAAAAAAAAAEASRELHIHELVALASCFILPMIGTWLLHTIRSKLSRPSEGLVSNYNLTIFLLASEIRPFAHLLKMVQARTLHLQRIVSSSSSSTTETLNHNTGKIAEISTRLDELEAHVASKAVDSPSPSPGPTPTPTIADLRKAIQPDIDALNRAVRRYEKRSAVTSFQTDSRLRDLEAQARDALALAAAAQRADSLHRPGLLRMGLNCFYAVWAIPVQIALGLVYLPLRVLVRCVRAVMAALVSGERGRVFKGKSPQPQPQSQSRSQRESGSRSRSLRPGQRSGSGVRGVEEPIPEYE